MINFDPRVEREFWGIVNASQNVDPIDFAAQDHRIATYSEHDCDLWEATDLLASVMDEYLLQPDDMMDVIKMGEQILRGGDYV